MRQARLPEAPRLEQVHGENDVYQEGSRMAYLMFAGIPFLGLLVMPRYGIIPSWFF